jgi:hypothetical protein
MVSGTPSSPFPRPVGSPPAFRWCPAGPFLPSTHRHAGRQTPAGTLQVRVACSACGAPPSRPIAQFVSALSGATHLTSASHLFLLLQVSASARVRDLAPGLAVDPAVCEYTTNNWQSSTEVTCTCSGEDGTTLTQTITAANVPFNQDSDTGGPNPQTQISFSISDTSGYRGDSPSYPVYIDTTGPEAQIGAPRRLKTPSIPITWTASDGVGSGVAGYDLEVSQDGGDWTRLLTDTQDTSYPFTGQPGHAYTFPSTGSGRAAPEPQIT